MRCPSGLALYGLSLCSPACSDPSALEGYPSHYPQPPLSICQLRRQVHIKQTRICCQCLICHSEMGGAIRYQIAAISACRLSGWKPTDWQHLVVRNPSRGWSPTPLQASSRGNALHYFTRHRDQIRQPSQQKNNGHSRTRGCSMPAMSWERITSSSVSTLAAA